MKIAICTPCYSTVLSEFAHDLAKMMLRTAGARIVFNGEPTVPEIEIFMRQSSMLAAVRNRLVKDALDWGANYLLWIDPDHSFPPESLLRLLSLNLPVVGVNQPRRTSPTGPTATDLDGNLIWTTEELAERGEVVQVGGLGLALCLIDMKVFESLHARAVAQGQESFWPLFAFETIAGQLKPLGEDVYFFRRLSEAGIPAYVDHALSWAVRHAHQRLLTNADTLADKEAFFNERAMDPTR